MPGLEFNPMGSGWRWAYPAWALATCLQAGEPALVKVSNNTQQACLIKVDERANTISIEGCGAVAKAPELGQAEQAAVCSLQPGETWVVSLRSCQDAARLGSAPSGPEPDGDATAEPPGPDPGEALDEYIKNLPPGSWY